MLVNLDPNKQAIEACFPQRREKENYSSLFSNGDKVQPVQGQKVLGQF